MVVPRQSMSFICTAEVLPPAREVAASRFWRWRRFSSWAALPPLRWAKRLLPVSEPEAEVGRQPGADSSISAVTVKSPPEVIPLFEKSW